MQSTITITGEASVLRARDSTDSSRRSQNNSITPHGSQLTTCFLTLRPLLVSGNPTACEINAPEAPRDAGESQAPEVQTDTLNKPAAAAREQAEATPSPFSSTLGIKAAGGDVATAGAGAPTGTDEVVYEEVSLQDLEFDAVDQQFLYPCPCGDLFELPVADLRAAAAAPERPGFAVASCPSCSLRIKVLFDIDQLRSMEEELSLSLLPEAT